MLSQLFIQNVAVIEKATINFGNGFNVFTGETGAGKSIVIDSINSILGQRTSKDIVRFGEDKATISALFSNICDTAQSFLIENGYLSDDETEVLVFREITKEGKSSCKINGKPATTSILKELGSYLINIHGQHDNQALMSPDKHIDFIDSFGLLESEIAKYRELYSQAQDIKRELSKISTDESQKAQRIDILEYQINEISAANLIEDEEEQLTARRKSIKNYEKIVSGISNAHQLLSGTDDNDGASSLVMRAADCLSEITEYFDEVTEIFDRISDIAYELQEFERDLQSHIEQFEYNPSELYEIEERLDLIHKLKKKYGNSVPEILSYLENAQKELDDITTSDEKIIKLTNELKIANDKVKTFAEKISQKRIDIGEKFTSAITKELNFLDMPNAKLEIQNEISAPHLNGIDNIEFLICTNLGELPKPLSKIASGGELSRIMLAIKNVIADKDNIETLIFDEVDTGVSGRAAGKIGKKLKEVANSHQVICVTHLAQIAALAKTHFLIKKDTVNGRTFTDVSELSREQRIPELARIMGGDNISETLLKSAEEMLDD